MLEKIQKVLGSLNWLILCHRVTKMLIEPDNPAFSPFHINYRHRNRYRRQIIKIIDLSFPCFLLWAHFSIMPHLFDNFPVCLSDSVSVFVFSCCFYSQTEHKNRTQHTQIFILKRKQSTEIEHAHTLFFILCLSFLMFSSRFSFVFPFGSFVFGGKFLYYI